MFAAKTLPRWGSAAAWLTLCVSCQGGCTEERPEQELVTPSESTTAAPLPNGDAAADPSESQAPKEPPPYELAARAIDEAMKLPSAPGAPGLEQQRATFLARAKSEPVVLVATPEYEASDSKNVEFLRRRVSNSGVHAWSVLEQLLLQFYNRPDLGRAAMLRNGYLYTEHANLAFSYISLIGAEHLFDDQRIWQQRGENTWYAERKGKSRRYEYVNGPHAGGRVRLLHLDRFGTGDPPEPLHRDFRSLKYRHHFERAKILHLTATKIVAELLYGERWVKTLIEADGARLEISHQLIAPELAPAVQAARERNARHQRLLQGLREAMVAQVNERLPFDEPKTEEGQEDGKLRGTWRWAYLESRNTYRFRDDRYKVFTRDGQALIPQVCVDFLIDTFERAGGSWWRPKGEPPGRTQGKWSFDDFDREALRRSKYFVNVFAEDHPEWFEIYTVPERERIELGAKPKFFRYVAKNFQQYQPGDIVFIRGETPWDEAEMHTHSFFVYENDPLTGTPILIAGNAGPANLWSWETEARRTPNRTLTHRVRPTLEFLERVVETEHVDAERPPVLVPTRD